MPKAKKKKENYFRRKKSRFDEFVWHLALGMWMLAIFVLSEIEGSGERYWDFWVFFERKSAHVFEFFVLAYLFWKTLSFYTLRSSQQFWLALLFSLLYASWDEFHQLFVFGREGKVFDMGVDLVGILLFFAIFRFWEIFLSKKKIPT